MTPADCRAVDAQIPTILATIMAKQSTFAATDRRPAQLLWTHTSTPDRDAVPADAVDAKPADMRLAWRDFGGFPATSRMRARIDVYQTPRGEWGWVLVLDMSADGAPWRRSINQGPETWRTHGWTRQEVFR